MRRACLALWLQNGVTEALENQVEGLPKPKAKAKARK